MTIKLSIKSRTALQFVISRFKKFLHDYKEQGLQPSYMIVEEFIKELEELIRYEK